MKTILLFGAGKSATVLIDYLINECAANKWKFIIADANKAQILAKTNHSTIAEACEVDITDDDKRAALIERAHVVISMMPPALHFLIAKDCVEYRKHLLTASYLDEKMKSLKDEINNRKLFFLCEMGLDPGIDHMSAMKLIDEIHAEGHTITAFKSHCGGLIAPESDNNPWHYKISWNPRNVVLAGKAGAIFKQEGIEKNITYSNLFTNCEQVHIDGIGSLAIYPNRDSLSYIPIYRLHKALTFKRTTLRYAAFCKGWDAIVQANLCDETNVLPTNEPISYKQWSIAIKPFITEEVEPLLHYLGLFSDEKLPTNATTSADVMQYLLENKLAMSPTDKDMIVMLHEIEHSGGKIESSLLVKGEDHLRTAMAKTVGLPLGIAAKLILEGALTLKGLHIPIHKEIYLPVLAELNKLGVQFNEAKK